MPSDKTVEVTGSTGAQVSWEAPTATDLVDRSVRVECSPGSMFALGDTTVSCTASDSRGNSDTKTFKVSVVDTTAPTISGLPQDITTFATSSSGAQVSYTPPTATDLVNGPVPVSCTRDNPQPGEDPIPVDPQGSLLPLGTATVTCSATDAAGNMATASFKVSVTYSWSGVLQPINGGSTGSTADDDSVFMLGSTVPVKFQLTGGSAGITDATAKLTVAKVSDGVVGTEVEADSTSQATTGNLLRHDPGSPDTTNDDQYIFNWGTKGLETGAGTYQLKIDLGDGTTNTVVVSLK